MKEDCILSGACQISQRYDDLNYLCRGFESSPHNLSDIETDRSALVGLLVCVVHGPTNTRRNNSVIRTSKRRRFDVIMTLSLRRVSSGYVTYLMGIAIVGRM